MKETNKYPDIDIFRLLAAFLVIAIHTSPLASYSLYGDFLLTRIAGRIAVPFFFMVSGFFLYSGQEKNPDRLISFVKKTAVLYGISILLYLPVNWYTGYFTDKHLIFKVLKDIFIDGTMYHLWYLPAAITGSIISFACLKFFGMRKAFILTSLLYLIGLMGDSYYGIISGLPVIGSFYKGLFQIMDYTRNGFFFAPLFFLLGTAFKKYKNLAVKGGKWMFLGSLLMMAVEGTLLRRAGVMRHDSMYLILPAVMFFLFLALLKRRGKEYRSFREISMAVYIIHPLVIIGIRGVSKVLGIQKFTVNNSIIHFLLVAAGSFLFGGIYYLSVKYKTFHTLI
ncbi:acyltransferase family protein [Anaerocolumna xylanovorans]|nr:acyltransferase [Anaerocolumna xylanovorans]